MLVTLPEALACTVRVLAKLQSPNYGGEGEGEMDRRIGVAGKLELPVTTLQSCTMYQFAN